MAWKYWIAGDECCFIDDAQSSEFWSWFIDLEKHCDPILVAAYHVAICKALLAQEKRIRKKKIPSIEIKMWFSEYYDQTEWSDQSVTRS
jgi:hypothetical protein